MSAESPKFRFQQGHAKAFFMEVSVVLQLLVTESFNKVKAQIIGLSAEFGLLCHGTLGMSFHFIL